MATLSTLVSFNGSDGDYPYAGLIADANGDLFGTTNSGGASGDGTVFEIAKTSQRLCRHTNHPDHLQRVPTARITLENGLVTDTTATCSARPYGGGAYGGGTVFEIVKTPTGYATTPTTLVSLTAPMARMLRRPIADAKGNLFGTTGSGGGDARHGVRDRQHRDRLRHHADHPGQLRRYRGDSRRRPIADANGDLFGTTYDGGARRRDGVRDLNSSRRLCHHANHPCPLQHYSDSGESVGRPHRRRQRQPVRRDLLRRRD